MKHGTRSGDGARLRCLFLCQGLLSVSLTLLMKSILRQDYFPFPWACVFMQCVLGLPIVGAIGGQIHSVKAVRPSHVNVAVVLSSLWAVCMASSFYGLRGVNVPMAVMGKNFSPLLTAILESAFLGSPLTARVLVNLALNLVGGSLYVVGDENRDLFGMTAVGMNTCLVAFTAICEKHIVGKSVQTPLGLSIYRMTLAAPMAALPAILGLEDWADAWRFLLGGGGALWAMMLAVVASSSMMTLVVFDLQRTVRATTMQVASLGYNILTTLISFAVFPKSREQMTVLAVVGYMISAISVGMYIYSAPDPAVTKKRRRAAVELEDVGAADASFPEKMPEEGADAVSPDDVEAPASAPAAHPTLEA